MRTVRGDRALPTRTGPVVHQLWHINAHDVLRRRDMLLRERARRNSREGRSAAGRELFCAGAQRVGA